VSPLFRATGTADFDRLYRDHAASVYRYAFAVLGNHPDAEDVTQQTFLNAYRAIVQGTRPRKAENWLVTIAHNEVRRHFRTNGKAVEVELEDERLAHPDAERSDPSLTDVLRALQQLAPTQRSALVMREFEGRSYAEIAEVLDITQSALETLLFRARRALAEQLEGALTCAEAEQAVSRRLDGRLPRREGRRLKTHLQECALCVRFVAAQKRQRSLLKGLSVMPVPASLFLFRPEPAAAAGFGATAVAAAGGSATVAGGSAAAGAGAIGVGAGLAAKAAAVTAVAAVAGGVGYGIAASPDRVLPAERPAGKAAVVARPDQGDSVHVRLAAPREDQVSSAPSAVTPAPPKAKKAKARPANAASHRQQAARQEKGAAGLAKKPAAAVKVRPARPATKSPTEATRTQPRRATRPQRGILKEKKPSSPAALRSDRPRPLRVVDPPIPVDLPQPPPKKQHE
jgi:RNA polymerase sigma-70 factor (ECF subfamily)